MISLFLAFFFYPFDFFFWAKWAISYIVIRVYNFYHRRRFDFYDINASDDPVKSGYLIPQAERDLESPFPENHLKEGVDEITFYGINSKSEYLLVRLTRGCDGTARAWLQLKLEDSRTFQLVEHAGFQQSFDGDKPMAFSCGRLQLRYIMPMRSWRIHYCGMLKEISGKEEKEAIFVKFVLLWKSSSDVFDVNLHTNPKGFASAMARSSWASPLVPPLQKLKDSFNYYVQSGAISGIVSVEGDEDFEIYLYGEKIRNMSRFDDSLGCKFTTVMGKTPENGFTVHLINASCPNAFENLSLGFVVRPDTIIENVKEVKVQEIPEISPKRRQVHFLSGESDTKREFILRQDAQSIVSIGSENCRGYFEVTYIEFTFNNKKGFGFVIDGELPIENVQTIKEEIPKVLFPNEILLSAKITDDISQFVKLSGGKGASLCKLAKLSERNPSFTVPKGIIITTEAYKHFLNSTITSAIQKLEDVVYGCTSGDVKDECREVKEVVVKSAVPDIVINSLNSDLCNVFGENFSDFKFAVRSSATGEDSESMSAAGQMTTYLGVRGTLEDILNCLKQCWASQFSYSAVEYKRRHGQLLDEAMAVVVQEMVGCDVAGVLFTCDPVTGNPSKITISANYGLGETVVDGSVEPDTVILARESNDKIEVKSITIGSKHEKMVLQDSGGIHKETIDENALKQCCLSKENALKLGKLALKVEQFYKSPRDIEWGILKDEVYLLQSRPVTGGEGVTDYEMIHDFDGALRYENEYFTMANVGEVMPGAATPLSMELMFRAFGNGVKKTVQQKGGTSNIFQSNYFMTGSTIFYNQQMLTLMELLAYNRMDSVASKGFMVSIFGRILEDPELLAVLRDVYPYEAPPRSLFQKIFLLVNMLMHDVGGADIKTNLEAIDYYHDECKTSIDMFNALMHDCPKYEQAFVGHMSASENSSSWNAYIFEILCYANKGKLDSEVYNDFSRLLRTSLEVESADVPQAIQLLAEQITKDIGCDSFKSMNIEDAEKWLRTSNSNSSDKFQEFLRRHGHRCYKESDMRTLTWDMDSKPLVKLLQNSCGFTNIREHDNYDKILQDLNISLGFFPKLLLKYILPNSQKAVRAREFFKSLSMRSVHNWRRGFRRLAVLMVREGRMPDADLVFFMKTEEIRVLLETRSPSIISRAIHRRKVFAATDKLKFPEIMRGFPKPMNEDEESGNDTSPDLIMQGTPVGHGTAVGYARVAIRIDEAADLQPGEILIAYSTDIGWSPYFPIIAGVVTELGGLISHGAVVSREYGLPCIIGLHGATKKFKTGDLVEIDGKKGQLKRLSSAKEQ